MKISPKRLAFFFGVSVGAASFIYGLAWMRRAAFLYGNSSNVSATFALIFIVGLSIGIWIWRLAGDARAGVNLCALTRLAAVSCICDLVAVAVFYGIDEFFLRASWSPSHRFLFFAASFGASVFLLLPTAVFTGGLLRCLGKASEILAFAGAAAGGALAAIPYRISAQVGGAATLFFPAAVNACLAGVALWTAEANWINGTPSNELTSGNFARLDPPVGVRHFVRVRVNLAVWVPCAVSSFALAALFPSCGRLLTMLFGPTFYGQGSQVAVILAGVAIGMVLYRWSDRSAQAHEQLLGLLTVLLALALALSKFALAELPFAIGYASLSGFSQLRITAKVIAEILVTSVPSILFGLIVVATFQSIRNLRARDPVALTFFAAGAGGLAGIFLTQLVLFPLIGLRGAITAAAIAVAAAGAAFWWRLGDLHHRRRLMFVVCGACLLFLIVLPRIPYGPFALGSSAFRPPLSVEGAPHEFAGGTQLLYYRDGTNASIAVGRTSQALFLNSDGKSQESTEPADMASQLLPGTIPMLLHPDPRNILIMGLGAGFTAAALSRYPVAEIDVVESEPATVKAAEFFSPYTHDVLSDARVHVLSGTPRTRLLLSSTRYDVIVSNLSSSRNWDAGSVMTVEFYRLICDHLNKSGIFVQALDLEDILPADLENMAATFHTAFPHFEIWTSQPGHLIFLGMHDVIVWDYARLSERFSQTNGVADDLRAIGIWSPFSIFGAQILGETDADVFTRNASHVFRDDDATVNALLARLRNQNTTAENESELSSFRRPGPPDIVGFSPERDLDADGTYLLGFAYASVGQSDLAIRHMERSTMMVPDRTMFWTGLANQYRAAGRITEARTAYERALAMDLNNLDALISLGEIRLEEGRLDWTRVLAERAIRLAPQDARVNALMNRLAEGQP